MSRLQACFRELRDKGRGGLVTFIMAGDPDAIRSEATLQALPAAGADIIELGMPFTDPMADGPSIERAGGRAIAAGQTLERTLSMVANFRNGDDRTPIVLMGYYNPVYAYGNERFAEAAAAAGVDGMIIVDLPPEEEAEIAEPARAAGLDMVRLVAPTSTDSRMDELLKDASGFIYYVAVRGITGTRSGDIDEISQSISRLRQRTDLPIAVGFGIRTPEQAAEIVRFADAAVVGSSIVETIEAGANDADGRSRDIVSRVTEQVSGLARAIHETAPGGNG